MNIEFQDLVQGYYPDKIPRDKHLIVICDRGLKSGRGKDWLKNRGYQAKIVMGGLLALQKQMTMEVNLGKSEKKWW